MCPISRFSRFVQIFRIDSRQASANRKRRSSSRRSSHRIGASEIFIQGQIRRTRRTSGIRSIRNSVGLTDQRLLNLIFYFTVILVFYTILYLHIQFNGSINNHQINLQFLFIPEIHLQNRESTDR